MRRQLFHALEESSIAGNTAGGFSVCASHIVDSANRVQPKKTKKKEWCPVGDSNSGFLGHNEGY